MIKTFADAGVPMVAGTDACGAIGVIPGFALHDEFDYLAEAGLDPLAILRMTTTEPARFLGREAAFGRILPGMPADLVLLAEDPLEDHHALHKIAGVMRDGSWWSRADLDAVLERIAANPGAHLTSTLRTLGQETTTRPGASGGRRADGRTRWALALALQDRVDARGAVGAVRAGMDGCDLLSQFQVAGQARSDDGAAACVVGGPGDLQELTGAFAIVAQLLLRLDERVHVHRVPAAKKAVARRRISTSPRRRRFSRRSAANSSCSSLVSASRSPASIWACLTQSRTAPSVRSKSLAT
ncbi:amidohydrolase family protein [Streptacidiphilus sp. PAMC 29251]